MIWKYELTNKPYACYVFEIEMPEQHKILSAQVQNDTIVIWAMVNPDSNYSIKKIGVVGTGQEMDFTPSQFIDTVQLGWYVGHVFEVE